MKEKGIIIINYQIFFVVNHLLKIGLFKKKRGENYKNIMQDKKGKKSHLLICLISPNSWSVKNLAVTFYFY